MSKISKAIPNAHRTGVYVLTKARCEHVTIAQLLPDTDVRAEKTHICGIKNDFSTDQMCLITLLNFKHATTWKFIKMT